MPLTPIDYEEKRDFRRMEIDCRVGYRVPGSDVQHYGAGRNLSATGIRFEAGEPHEPGARLEISLEPANAALRPFSAVIEVVRCIPAADGRYEIAGEIREHKG